MPSCQVTFSIGALQTNGVIVSLLLLLYILTFIIEDWFAYVKLQSDSDLILSLKVVCLLPFLNMRLMLHGNALY